MPELNKDRIFNESPKKVLIREYENLKKDYTKMNALKYKDLYESASLSFILENSRYIFSEPIKGYEFYKNIIESTVIPFQLIGDEKDKVYEYLSENVDNMSDTQKTMYENLYTLVESKFSNMINSVNLYVNMMENTDTVLPIYDALYKYRRTGDTESYNEIVEFVKDTTSINIMDTLNVGIDFPELSSTLYEYVDSVYYGSPTKPSHYSMNTFTTNILSRMMKDKYISERVSSIPNMNLRHYIIGLSGVEDKSTIDSFAVEHVTYNHIYSSPENSINRIFEDDVFSEACAEVNAENKLYILECKKAVTEMNLGFVLIDNMSEIAESAYRNSIVENICIESSEIEKIPNDTQGQISLLKEAVDDIQKEIDLITEKYFSANGLPSSVVSKSLGVYGQDRLTAKKEGENEESHSTYYTPRKDSEDDVKNSKDKEDEKDTENSELSEEDEEYKKREEKKKEKTDKYSKMDIDNDEYNSVLDSINESDEILKPQKKNIFQRIQNRALDRNVKFKKKLAEAKRKSVDAKNAVKAEAKIPMSVGAAIKKQVDEWDEADDNRRKEYIIKPGFRKKYFRALKLCIMHYGAFAINPVLNIVLAICQKFSKDKDERIRNELRHELEAEIKVCDEKIEDARANGDREQKYKLMRIKEKLQAEEARVAYNTKVI